MFDCLVCSPPYADAGANTKGHGIVGAKGSIGNGCKADEAEYGTSSGQLGAMRPGHPHETPMNEVETLEWDKDTCYGLSWQGLITPESFAHPAKMARGQLFRLVRWLFETGRIRKGETILDCFGGVGTTGIAAASSGCRFVGVELEPRFVTLAQANFELHRRVWEAAGDPQPVILQGDSRRLAEVVGPVLAQCVLSSPPYAASLENGGGSRATKLLGTQSGMPQDDGYGTTPGQLGAMPLGGQRVAGVLSSPPYAANSKSDFLIGEDGKTRQRDERRGYKQGSGCFRGSENYGDTPGQLGRLREGNLPPGDALASGVVSSPPYEGSFSGEQETVEGVRESMRKRGCTKEAIAKASGHTGSLGYGTTEGNVGNTSGETFWDAAKQIVSQCHLLLKPGATTAWVVKSYVKAGAIVPFPDQWAALLEATGFKVTHRIRCHLVSETREADLFGGETVKRKERKSFFRRLHEKKSPHTRIDFEEIVVAVKVGEGGSAGAVVRRLRSSE